MHPNKISPVTVPVGVPVSLKANPLHRILLVDEDPYMCHLGADTLIRHGYVVNVAEDGAAAWEELQCNQYELLITGDELPKASGVKLIKLVRAAHLTMPVVMVADKLPVRLDRSTSLHIAATLVKPFAMTALLSTVQQVLHTPACASRR